MAPDLNSLTAADTNPRAFLKVYAAYLEAGAVKKQALQRWTCVHHRAKPLVCVTELNFRRSLLTLSN